MLDYHSRNYHELCWSISVDEPLKTMFRVNGNGVSCPITGTFSFSYSRGHGLCNYPLSSLHQCAGKCHPHLIFCKTNRSFRSVNCTMYHISLRSKVSDINRSMLCSMSWNVTMSVCDMNHVFIWCLPFYLKCQGGSQLTSPATSYLMIRCLKAHSQRGGKFKLGEHSLSCVKIKFRYPLFNIPSCNIGSSIRSPLRLFQAFLDCMLWKYYWSNQNNVFKQNEP